MLWASVNHHVLRAGPSSNSPIRSCAHHDILRRDNHGLLCTGANDRLLRGANDRVLSAAAGGNWYHTRRLCPGDLCDTASDLLCTCDIYHGLSRLVVSTIFRAG
jgi:hypothetical protein